MRTPSRAISHKHLNRDLDELTFRFNRRRFRAEAKLFFRLVQQAVNIEPVSNAKIETAKRTPQHKKTI